MEINLITRNGITPNPTVEFLELCQKALDYVNSNSFNDLMELESKYIDICTPESLTMLQKDYVFGKLIITVLYASRVADRQHRFCTHFDSVIGCTGTELNPVMFAY
jgi:hypothetical protein